MGVLGLTRWANETERLISSELTLPVPHGSGSALVDGEPAQLESKGDWLVIDAWAWVHYVWHSMNTNVSAGFHLVVVIDGPRLHQKLGATLSRTQNYVRLNAKLMRAGTKLRTDPEFEHGRILPPGLSECLFSVLDKYDVETQVGAEEVDVAIAQLADERAGYVLSRDSDFLVLCGNAPQCKGYVPLGSIEFIAKETGAGVQEEAPADDDDGFTTVSTAKSKRGKKQQAAAKLANLPHVLRKPVLPAERAALQEESVRFRCFSSGRAAAQLKIPMNLLPVFAALVGTEQRSTEHVELFNTVFHGVNNRMPVIAQVLAQQYTEIKEQSDATPTDTDAGEHAIDLRDPVLRLLAQTFDALVDYGRKRRGAQITVSWEMRKTIVLNMHSVALAFMPGNRDEAIERFMEKTEIGALQPYQEAYWKRQLDQVLVSVLLERIYIARVFLEEPEEPPSQRVVVRGLRSFVWSALLGVWLAAHPDAKDPEPELVEELEKATIEGDEAAEEAAAAEENDDEDEDDEDEDEDEDEEPVDEDQAQRIAEQTEQDAYLASLPKITEYTRTEYSLRKDEVPVPPLVDLLDSVAQRTEAPLSKPLSEVLAAHRGEGDDASPLFVPDLPEETRVDLWLYAHHALLPQLRALPQDLWAFAAALRYAIVANHERLGQLRTRHNWTRAEVEAAVYAGVVVRNLHARASPDELQAVTSAYAGGSPPNRSITLSTMLAFVLETSHWLTQALLLGERVGHALYEPPLFHARLGEQPSDAWAKFEDAALAEQVLDAVLVGLDARLGRPRAKQPALSKAQTPRPRRHHGWLEETLL
ncbi:hypothetical protein CBS9595_003193 [Malassezia furfur]|nr:hypothetical protein CBS9595_003193 [Malassezia furfur]